eukprot:243780-Prymnesium_polylepis.2
MPVRASTRPSAHAAAERGFRFARGSRLGRLCALMTPATSANRAPRPDFRPRVSSLGVSRLNARRHAALYLRRPVRPARRRRLGTAPRFGA